MRHFNAIIRVQRHLHTDPLLIVEQGMIDALPIDLTNSPKNKTMSGPLVDMIRDSRGTIEIFNPSSNKFRGLDFDTGTYNIISRK